MSKRVKKIYKCVECETMITIVTKVHELPESIICPCDKVAESQGLKWESLTTNPLSIRLKEQQKTRKEYRLSLIFLSLNASSNGSEKKLFLGLWSQYLTRTGDSRGRPWWVK